MIKCTMSMRAVAIMLAATACSDRSPSAPAPPPPGKPLGMLIGTVSADSFSATFVPATSDFSSSSAVSAAIYGGPATVNVFGTNTQFTTIGPRRTWRFNVAMRNLLSYAIGSNYTSVAPLDTGGVFIFFSALPVVTAPQPCNGCQVNIVNAMGTRDFTGAAQPFFWYRDRPTAKVPVIGTDTTSDLSWTFQTTSNTPPDTVHSFSFALLVSAMWPPPNETTWQVTYDGTTDSLPDRAAEPEWQKFSFQGNLGKDDWSPAGLDLSGRNGQKDIEYSRHDSLGNMSAFMDVAVNVDVGDPIIPAALFGFAEPVGGKNAVVAITAGRTEFAQVDNSTGVWSLLLGSGTTAVIGANTYRLRKFAKDSIVLCVNGARALKMPYASLEATGSATSSISAFFGLQGTQHDADAIYTLVRYTIGSDGGGCS